MFKRIMGVGKSKGKGILPFEEAMERLSPEHRKALEVAFSQATEKEDLTGKLKRSQFSQIPILIETRILLPSEGKIHGDCIFHAFDRGNKGYLVFEDFAIGFVIAVLGTPTEKLKFTLRLYDWDDNGYVSKVEFMKIFLQFVKEDAAVEDSDRRKKWGLGRRKEDDLRNAVVGHVDEIFGKVRGGLPLHFVFQINLFISTPKELLKRNDCSHLSWKGFSRAVMRERNLLCLLSMKITFLIHILLKDL